MSAAEYEAQALIDAAACMGTKPITVETHPDRRVLDSMPKYAQKSARIVAGGFLGYRDPTSKCTFAFVQGIWCEEGCDFHKANS